MKTRFAPTTVWIFALSLTVGLLGLASSPGRSSHAAQSFPVSSCGTVIAAPGNYHITQDLSCGPGFAITITADDVNLLFNGHTVDGSSEGTVGVYVTGSNVSIAGHGTIRRFGFNVVLDGSSDSRIVNLTTERASSNSIHLVNFSNHNSIINCTARNNQGSGIRLLSSNNSTLISNTLNGNFDHGVFLTNAHDNVLRANLAEDNNREGILVVSGSSGNLIQANRAHSNGIFDLADDNLVPPCDSNTWKSNKFGTANQSCIQ